MMSAMMGEQENLNDVVSAMADGTCKGVPNLFYLARATNDTDLSGKTGGTGIDTRLALQYRESFFIVWFFADLRDEL